MNNNQYNEFLNRKTLSKEEWNKLSDVEKEQEYGRLQYILTALKNWSIQVEKENNEKVTTSIKIDSIGHTYIKKKGKTHYKQFGHAVTDGQKTWFIPDVNLENGDTLKCNLSYNSSMGTFENKSGKKIRLGEGLINESMSS